jgi:hypothetical protein
MVQEFKPRLNFGLPHGPPLVHANGGHVEMY